jgi:hypothetical protein
MLERRVQLVDRLGAESVAHLGAVEGDAHGTHVLGAVIRDVLELEARDCLPQIFVEDL